MSTYRNNVLRLQVTPSRYGFLIGPYKPQALFNYNHVYNSIEDIIMDFKFNGWVFKGIIDGFYEFERI
jgi:hypothetical protein